MSVKQEIKRGVSGIKKRNRKMHRVIHKNKNIINMLKKINLKNNLKTGGCFDIYTFPQK